MSDGRAPTAFQALALAQGAYYITTGIWSLVDIRSFQKVTGPKTDLWLVKTVGCLVTVSGAVLCYAGLRNRPTPESAILGAGSALALMAIDVNYVSKGRISPIYLGDAAAEAVLAALWARVYPEASGRHD